MDYRFPNQRFFYPLISTGKCLLSKLLAHQTFPIYWALGLISCSCTSIYHSRRSIQELDQTFRVNKGQDLYFSPKRGSNQSKRLLKSARAALYLQNDTLFVEFLKVSLPIDDHNPATIDVSDSAYVFFVNPKPKQLPVNQTSPWFRYHFTSFDTDLLTIPFKYRLAQPGLVPQLTTNANAAVYVGLRYDQGFQRNVFYHHQQRSDIRSFSIGAGGLFGLSASAVGPFSTAGAVQDDYEGVCLNYGLAAIFGYRAVTLGLAVGYDYLLDRNRSLWAYQHKPWLGITVGLNLN